MEFVPCALCGADDARLERVLRDLGSGLPGRFDLVCCRQCGLRYLNPRPSPDEMVNYYPLDYRPYKRAIEDERWALMRWMRRRSIRRRRRAVERYVPRRPGRVLDVGCATGIFLAEMRDAGWRTTGIEMSEIAADYASDRFGLTIIPGTLEQADLPPESFDLITFWDVLEHTHNPRATLDRVWNLLRPEGVVVATVPNYHSLDRKLFGSAWIGFDAPRHLTVFAPDTLQRLLESAGFAILELRCGFGGFFSFAASLRYWAVVSPSRFGLHQMLVRSTEIPGLRLPFEPFSAIMDRIGWGNELLVLGRKIDNP